MRDPRVNLIPLGARWVLREIRAYARRVEDDVFHPVPGFDAVATLAAGLETTPDEIRGHLELLERVQLIVEVEGGGLRFVPLPRRPRAPRPVPGGPDHRLPESRKRQERRQRQKLEVIQGGAVDGPAASDGRLSGGQGADKGADKGRTGADNASGQEPGPSGGSSGVQGGGQGADSAARAGARSALPALSSGEMTVSAAAVLPALPDADGRADSGADSPPDSAGGQEGGQAASGEVSAGQAGPERTAAAAEQFFSSSAEVLAFLARGLGAPFKLESVRFEDRRASLLAFASRHLERAPWEAFVRWMRAGHPGSEWRGKWSLSDLLAPTKGPGGALVCRAYGIEKCLAVAVVWDARRQTRSETQRSAPGPRRVAPEQAPEAVGEVLANWKQRKSGRR